MGTITKTPVQRTVTISLDAGNQVTHAWQQAVFSIQEDGVEISRQHGGPENLEPADIGAAVPQADLLRQLADQKAESAKAIVERDAQIAALTAAHADILARSNGALAALQGTAGN
jgi:hypothetical protein